MPTRHLTATLILAVALVALAGSPAAAAAPYRAVEGARGAGPAKYDKVFVQRFGPTRAKRVLVLVPGFLGGAGDFRLIARDIVRRVPGLAVWAVDRRQQAFEDTSVFAKQDAGRALDYYLGFKYRRVLGEDVPFVGRWGLELALKDLRRVVRKAGAGRRQVILGGHSLGASTAAAYAAWDFDGRAGYRDIDGLVLIDGGLLGSFSRVSRKSARSQLAELRRGEDVFDDLLGLGIPEIAGIFPQVAALYARKRPDAPSVLQDLPLLPEQFKPPVPATNEAALGFAFDRDSSPDALELIRINAGRLARAGDPRAWVDGGLTPIQRFARVFSADRPNAVEWYFPRRLRLDVNAMSPLRRTAVTRLLRLRPFHARRIDVPLYAYQTDLTEGRVLRGARRLVRRSRIARSRLVADPRASHLDPLVAAPRRNAFLKTVVRFLRDR